MSAFDSFFVQTADGGFAPANGLWGQTLLRLSPKDVKVIDYFTPTDPRRINAKDPTTRQAAPSPSRSRIVNRGVGGQGRHRLSNDARSLGGPDHRNDALLLKAGNDEMSYASTAWGALATRSTQERALGVRADVGTALEGRENSSGRTATRRSAAHAFQPCSTAPPPGSCRSGCRGICRVPDSPVVANGIVLAISTGENTLQRTPTALSRALSEDREPPLSRAGNLTAAERGSTRHASCCTPSTPRRARSYSPAKTPSTTGPT